jgi:hypothetical protein
MFGCPIAFDGIQVDWEIVEEINREKLYYS